MTTSQMQPDNRALFWQSTFTPRPSRCIDESKLHVRGRTLLCMGSDRPRASTYKKKIKKTLRLREFKFLAPNQGLSEQFFVFCAQTSWSTSLKKFLYPPHTSAHYIFQYQLCRIKALGVVQRQTSKMPTILYIYRWVIFEHLNRAKTLR